MKPLIGNNDYPAIYQRQTHHVPSRAMDGRSVDNTQTLVATIKVMDHQVTSNNKHREGA